jgi:tRNA (adenine22-N1)-methyltransferase
MEAEIKTKKAVLSSRLRAIKSLVVEDLPLLDVGADHALLSLALAEDGYKAHIYASEAAEGPFERMKKAVSFYEEEKHITCLFGDGLTICPEEVKEAVIAGMGGRTISQILLQGKEALNHLSYLVLEPQSEPELVRESLSQLGFGIEKELYTKEQSRIYPIILASREGEKIAPEDYEWGRYGFEAKDPLLYSLLFREEEEQKKILLRSDLPEDVKLKIKKRLTLLRKGIRKWKAGNS